MAAPDILRLLTSLFQQNFGKPNSQRQQITDPIAKQAVKTADQQALAAAATPLTTTIELGMSPLLSAITYSPDAEGAIRKGGRTDLNMAHNIGDSIENFLRLVTGRGSISNPSIAIASNNVYPFARSPTLVMNPASHAFDPDISRANQLFNRDAYSTRAKIPVQRSSPVEFWIAEDGSIVYNKGRDVESTHNLRRGADARFTEGGGPDEASQTAAILASPKFRSLAEYERSPAGAKALTNSGDRVISEANKAGTAYKDWLYSETPFDYTTAVKGQPLSASIRNEANMLWLRQRAVAGDEEAVAILKQLQQIPSNYAELKVLGELGITPKNVSAFLIPEGTMNAATGKLADKFMDTTGIRTGTPFELAPKELAESIESFTAAAAKYFVDNGDMLGSAKGAYKTLPASIAAYTDGPARLLDILDSARSGNTNKTASDVQRMILNSNKFASDVASSLTARDLDAVSTPNILNKLLGNP